MKPKMNLEKRKFRKFRNHFRKFRANKEKSH